MYEDGQLWYDADGNSDTDNSILFATLPDAPALTASDFAVV